MNFILVRSYFLLFQCLLLVTSCNISDIKTEKRLRLGRDTIQVDLGKLERGFDENTFRGFTKEGIEYGIICLENKDTVKYWFHSHHLAGGNGGALFELPDGSTKFITDIFCCEVQLPNEGKYPDAKSLLKAMQ